MSVSTAIMAIASAVAGTFGMNIPFMYNERAGSYKWVSVAPAPSLPSSLSARSVAA